MAFCMCFGKGAHNGMCLLFQESKINTSCRLQAGTGYDKIKKREIWGKAGN